MNFISKSFLIFTITTTQCVIAQSGTISPYSKYGYGMKNFENNSIQSGLGGLGTVYESPGLEDTNFSNPAANRTQKLTNFNFGISSDLVNFKNNTNSTNRSTTYIANISLGLPLGEKSKLGIGFQPYSTVGYKTNEVLTYKTTKLQGEGGINSLHAQYSYSINQNFSIGLRGNYLFGNIRKNEYINVKNAQLSSSFSDQDKVSGVQFTVGGLYKKSLLNKDELSIGATYTIGSNLDSKVSNLEKTYQLVNNVETVVDTVAYKVNTGIMKLPHEIKLGVAYTKGRNWMVGAQGEFEAMKDFSSPSYTNTTYHNRYKLATGGWWIPETNSYKSYLSRITYRAGFFYEQTGLYINNTDINNYGLSLGVGLPMGRAEPSELNLSLVMGQKGTIQNALMQEDYIYLKANFSFYSKWFRKKVYN